MKNKSYMEKRNKKGQFYLVATIIIVGIVIGLAVIFNYSTKTNSYEVEEIAKELNIESQKVMDYDIAQSTNKLENFAGNYSSYVGEDKDIYFIIVGEVGNGEAYKFTDGEKVDFSEDLNVTGEEIQFGLNETYTFKREKGKNFYFIIIYNKGGEIYVYTG